MLKWYFLRLGLKTRPKITQSTYVFGGFGENPIFVIFGILEVFGTPKFGGSLAGV